MLLRDALCSAGVGRPRDRFQRISQQLRRRLVFGQNVKLLLFANTEWYLYNFRLALAEAIVARGHSVTLVSPPGPYGERLLALGMDWRPLPLARRSLNPARELSALGKLVGLYRELHPDLVHHFTLECILLGSLAASLAGVPAVVNAVAGLGSIFTGGSMRARILRRPVGALLKHAFRRSEAILQNPEDLEGLVAAHIVERSRAHLIRGSGVDTARFAVPLRNGTAGAGNILLASRLLRAKGVEEFVEAALRLKPKFPQLSFQVAGTPDPGSPDAIPNNDIERWSAGGLIEFLGHREDMPSLLAGVALVALPTYYGEGVPRILLEAAASGLPLIATDVPGCREVVRHEENGLLIGPRDPVALAAAIERLMLDPGERARMGKRSRAIACEEFSEELVVSETIKVYDIAVRAKTRSRPTI